MTIDKSVQLTEPQRANDFRLQHGNIERGTRPDPSAPNQDVYGDRDLAASVFEALYSQGHLEAPDDENTGLYRYQAGCALIENFKSCGFMKNTGISDGSGGAEGWNKMSDQQGWNIKAYFEKLASMGPNQYTVRDVCCFDQHVDDKDRLLNGLDRLARHLELTGFRRVVK